MIRKQSHGWIVYNEKGEKLSKPYKTKKEAEERLRQIEYFKHEGKSK